MKKIIKIIAYTFLGLVLVILILPFVFKDELKNGLRQALNENLNAEVTFSDVGLNFWKDFPNAHLNVENLKIIGIDTFQHTNLFESPEIQMEIGLLSLIKKSTPYSVRSLEIHDASLNLVTLANGQTNYLIIKPNSDTIAYNIDLKFYTITNSNLSYYDVESNLILDIKNLNHSGSGNLSEEIYDLNTYSESSDFNLTYNDIPYISQANFEADAIIQVNLLDEKYTFKDNRILLNAFPFKIDGYTQLFPESIDLDFTFIAEEANFAKLYSLLPMVYTSNFQSATITGSGDISGFLKGKFSSEQNLFPTYALKAMVNEGEISYDRLPHPIKNINTSIEISNDGREDGNIQIKVPAFSFNVQEDFVKGHFNSIGPIDNPYFDLKLDAGFNLDNWKNSVPLSPSSVLKGKGKIDLLLQTDLKSIQDNRYDKISFASNSYISNLEVKLENIKTIKAEKIEVNGDPKRLEGKVVNLIFNDSDFSFDLTLVNPLKILIDKGLAKGKVVLNSRRINLNSLYDVNSASDSTSQNNNLKLFGDFDLEANVNEIVFEDKLYKFNTFSGNLNQDEFKIKSLTSQVGESDISASGQISNINQFLNQSGKLKGNLDLSSQNFVVDPWLKANDSSEDSTFILPPNTEIDINLKVDKLLYKGLNMNNIQANGSLFNQTLQISEAKSEALGGIFAFEGLYATPENAQPLFDFKLDLQSILFQKAFQELNTFRAIAPIAKFLSGKFNTTLIMSGSINNQMMPIWNQLDASGFIETLDSKISGFEVAERLAEKLGIEKLREWNIENTRNWFEIADGLVQLKENTFNLGDGITFTVGGEHGIGSTMAYDIYMEIPRSLLKENKITAVAEGGLVFLEKEASKLGINLDQGENIMIKIELNGKLSSPDIKIRPMGTTGKSATGLVEDQIKMEKENLDKVIDSLQQKKNEAIDSIKEDISQKSKDAIDSLKTRANSKLDSLINKALSDSTSTSIQDVLKEKARKDEGKLKNVLEKWSPFKKKPTTDTTKVKS